MNRNSWKQAMPGNHESDTFKVALDSNTMTYLNESMELLYDPGKDSSNLVEERVAILRIWLCTELVILPVVRSEYRAIKDRIRRHSHEQLHFVLLSDQDIRHPENVAELIRFFYRFHRKEKDCRLLAEAIDVKVDYLLTCDKDFTKRLARNGLKFGVKFIRPNIFWSDVLHSGQGCTRQLEPHPSNPLSTKNWWRWQ